MNWINFGPEIFSLVMIFVFLGLSVSKPDAKREFVIALALSAIGVVVSLTAIHGQKLLFFDTYRVDLFSQVFKVMLFSGLFLIVCISGDLSGIDEKSRPEYYLLLSVCTLAMTLLVSSVHLITVYVSLELSSYSLYALVFFRKKRAWGTDAGMKYFFIGAGSSAVMLFGLAILFGTTGTAYLSRMTEVISSAPSNPVYLVGLLLTLGGFFFKLALFPFHFWAPDVYEGAANQAAGFIATASKVAAIAILIRVTAFCGNQGDLLAHGLAVLAIVSMTAGNLSAIAQKDLKRLLAFSSIAHAGYVLIGILSMNETGYASAVFYAMTVLVLKFTCFLVVVKVAWNGGNVQLERLAGLHRRSPILALSLMMALFGLAGIPPTIGFTGKLLVFMAAMKKGYFVLVLIAMVNVLISLYYYLLVVKAAYLDEPSPNINFHPISIPTRVLAGILVFFTVFAGIYPRPFIDMAQSAVRVFFLG